MSLLRHKISLRINCLLGIKLPAEFLGLNFKLLFFYCLHSTKQKTVLPCNVFDRNIIDGSELSSMMDYFF